MTIKTLTASMIISLCVSFLANAAQFKQTILISLSNYEPYIDFESPTLGSHGKIIFTALQKKKQPYLIEYSSWTKVEQLLDQGQTCSFGWLKTPSREQRWQYSSPYIEEYRYIWGLKGKIFNIKNINDLKSYSIAVSRGYSYGKELDSILSEMRVDESVDDIVNFRKLLANRVDFVISSKEIKDSILGKYFTDNIDTIEIKYTHTPLPFHFVCSKGYKLGHEAISKLNQAFAKAKLTQ